MAVIPVEPPLKVGPVALPALSEVVVEALAFALEDKEASADVAPAPPMLCPFPKNENCQKNDYHYPNPLVRMGSGRSGTTPNGRSGGD